MASMAERRIARVTQVVTDLSGEALRDQRVLDLGCHEGGFSLALARLGAREVVAIEAREENISVGIARRDAEGLDQVEFIHGDVRTLSRERHGEFDVVLCLGLLYHLDAPEVFDFTRELAAVCRGYAVIETQIGLSRKETIASDGSEYAGRWYAEDTAQRGASVGNRRSFWMTKASLLNLLADVGFTSVSEVLNPVVPVLASYRDHTTLIANKGATVQEFGDARWPERLPKRAHPAQGVRYVARDRFDRSRGGGLPLFFRP